MKIIYLILSCLVFQSLADDVDPPQEPPIALISTLSDDPNQIVVLPPDELKAGLGSALTQLVSANTQIAQNLVAQLGTNLQGTVGLLNTAHQSLQIKKNTTLNSYTNALAQVAAAHAVLITNQTTALLAHLDTHKEIAQNVSLAFVQAASSLVNSTATLAVTNWQNHISLGQSIINSFLFLHLQNINSTAQAHQTILRGFSSLLEQKMKNQQLFYGNVSLLIQNITDASVHDLQVKMNETQFKFERLNNKSMAVSGAISGFMHALLDTKNSSALSFVSKTTVLLDAIADIVNMTNGIHTPLFHNKTGTLLQSVGGVFDILANASHTKHDVIVGQFNSSVSALTDAIVGISESVEQHKSNVSMSFANHVGDLLQHLEMAHDNVTEDLQSLFNHLASAFTGKIKNFTTTSHHLKMLRDQEDGLLSDFEDTLDAVGLALQRGVLKLGQHVKVVEWQTEETAVEIYNLMEEDYELFKCAERLTPEFQGVFARRAIKPIYCSADTLKQSLNAVFGDMEALLAARLRGEVDAAKELVACQQRGRRSRRGRRQTYCSDSLIATRMESIVGRFKNQLQDYLEESLPGEFQTTECYIHGTSELSFEGVHEMAQRCSMNRK